MYRSKSKENNSDNRMPFEITEFLNGKASKDIELGSSKNLEVTESTKFLEEKSPPTKTTDKDVENREIGNGTKENKGWQSYMGILLTICSGLMFATTGLIVKYLKGYHALNLGFFRFTGMLIPSIPFLMYVVFVQKKKVFKSVWPLTQRPQLKTMSVLFARAILGCIAITCHFYAIQYMSLADAMVIGSISPVFVTLVAHIFLGEKCGIFPVIIALMTIVGVGVIVRPPMLTGEEEYNMDTLIGAGFALGRMLLTSLAIVAVRGLREVHVAVVLFGVGLLQLLQNTSLALIMGVFSLPSDPYHLLLACGVALASFIGQMTLTLALKCEQAGPFAIVRTCDVIFAFILQFIFLGTAPDYLSIIGAVVVLVSICLTVFRKWLGSLPKDHHARKTYWFVLK